MTKQIVGKTRRYPRNSRNSIRILIKKFEKLILARKSGLSSEQEKVYEKTYENKELVQVLNYICIRNLKLATADIAKFNVPEEILSRNYI